MNKGTILGLQAIYSNKRFKGSGFRSKGSSSEPSLRIHAATVEKTQRT